MATHDDKPILTGFEITNTLEIISDALVGGDNWESLEKRKTASKWLKETRYSVEYQEDDKEDFSIESVIVRLDEKK